MESSAPVRQLTQDKVQLLEQGTAPELIGAFRVSLIFPSVRSWGLVSHSAANIGAALAGLGASLAMVHLVLRALSSAGLARVGTKRTHRLHVFIASRNRCGSKTANIGAFQIQLDAGNHRFRILLRETGGSTLKTGRHTLVASAQAFDFFLTHHLLLLGCRRFGTLIFATRARTVCSIAHVSGNEFCRFRRRAGSAASDRQSRPETSQCHVALHKTTGLQGNKHGRLQVLCRASQYLCGFRGIMRGSDLMALQASLCKVQRKQLSLQFCFHGGFLVKPWVGIVLCEPCRLNSTEPKIR